MHPISLQRDHLASTPSNNTPTSFDPQKSATIDTNIDHHTLKTKTYSFQDLPSDSLLTFCHKISEIHALLNIGKKITDPNVLMLNSTQKEMVEMIVDNNKHAIDQKSKFLTQRAGKYIKLLWKTEKYNESILQVEKKVEKVEPHYASPIHNFKRAKNANHSLSPLSQRTERSIPGKSISIAGTLAHLNKKEEPTSRVKRVASQDQKFSNVRLGKYDTKSKKQEKSFEVDLTKNIAWRTMNTTKNFDNMLKILKKK